MPSMSEDEVDLDRDIWLGRNGDAAARERVERSAAEQWPSSRWRPFDAPPVDVRDSRRARLAPQFSFEIDGDVGTIVGLYAALPEEWPPVHTCPTCVCPRQPPRRAGWWAFKRDCDGEVIAVYPPTLTPLAAP